ncbi:unnamed protein product [Colletotrichum noveboracense]|uniref:Uncharacterized protein n=2 Tax=Colletotrichum gloeosporioides species complex TaxID=2707338 RepID=A0A9W4S1B2_9PEZI|nr:unnamed protein product [Colletotrichum noveboracense]
MKNDGSDTPRSWKSIGTDILGFYVSDLEQKTAPEEPSAPPHPHQISAALKKVGSSSGLKSLNWGFTKDAPNSSKSGQRWFGKSPWHRRDSNDTISSVTSSVREVLAGRTPATTPDPETFLHQLDYTMTPYPAGEAMRVKTPPLHEDTADGRPRGFFGNHPEPASGFERKKVQDCHKQLPTKPKEWWDAKPDHRPRPKKTMNAQPFEFDIPEHLPSSPMCPTNPKHPSGGKGMCVYHGRRREGSLLKVGQTVNDRRQGSEVSITSERDNRD